MKFFASAASSSLTVVFTLVVVYLEPSIALPNAACDDYDAIDACSIDLFVLNSPARSGVISTRDEIQQQCSKSKESINCLQRIVDGCHKNAMVKQYFRMMIKGPKNVIKKTCNKKGIQEMISSKRCREASKGALDTCGRTIIQDTMRVHAHANETTWLATSCCFASKAQGCIKDVVRSTDACNDQAKDFLIKSYNELVGESMEMACGSGHNYKSEKCKKIFSTLGPVPANEKVPLTVIPVSLKVMTKFLA